MFPLIRFNLILNIILFLFPMGLKGQNATAIWANSMGSNLVDNGYLITHDQSENIYTIGTFRNKVDFDPSVDTLFLTPTNVYNTAGFIQKLASNGHLDWAAQVNASLTNLKVISNGNFLLTGRFQDSVDVGLGVVSHKVYSYGTGGFICQYDSSSNLIWSRVIDGDVNLDREGITLDSLENIFVVGTFWDTTYFDPGSTLLPLVSSGSTDSFVLKLDSSGSFQWVKTFSCTHIVISQTVDIYSNGNLIITGFFDGLADFDPGTGISTVQSSGNEDIFLLELTSSGLFVQVKTFGGPDYERFNAVFIDKWDNLFTTGSFYNTLDFDPSATTFNMTSTGTLDLFVQKFDSSLNMIWTKQIGGNRLTRVYDMHPDSSNNLILTGNFTDSVDFAPGPNTALLLGGVYFQNSFLLKLTPYGQFIWVKDLGTKNSKSTGYGVTCTPNNNIYCTGIMDSINFPPSWGVPSLAAREDAYVIKFKDCYPTQIIDSIEACNSYTWRNGITYYTNNFTAKDTIVTITNCDSVFLLNLTINFPQMGIDTVQACDGYTWINGVYYTNNNFSAKDTLTTAAGCDSIVTLSLTINHSSSSIDSITACGSYTWIDGLTYVSDNNTATFTFLNSLGCDSLVTLKLSIIQPSYYTDTIVACHSYTWIDGNSYTSNTTGIFHNIPSAAANGCDSIIILDLTIIPSNNYLDIYSVCDSLSWIDGITYYTSNDTSTYIIPNGASSGCDSIINLDLTILNDNKIDVIHGCNTYTWINGITYYSDNTTATISFINQFGCDSTVHLELNIHHTTTFIDSINSCDEFTWIDGITYLASNNTATHTLINHNGCDSVVTLYLQMRYSTNSTDTITACQSFTWVNGITYNSSSSSISHIASNSQGCDSLMDLNLTIIPVIHPLFHKD